MQRYSLLFILALLVGSTAGAATGVEEKYQDFKNEINKKYGLSFGVDVSLLMQRGSPSGKQTAWQTQYYPYVNWTLFESKKWGSGTINFAYTANRYWGTSAQNIGNSIGVAVPFNDYPTYSNSFDELSYTQQFGGSYSWLSVTVGQFPIYNFDGTEYDANQQTNFLNYAFAQNGSSAYSTAGLGAYITASPNEKWSFTVGMQDAHNIDGNGISSDRFGKRKYTTFATATFTSTIKDWGAGKYSVIVYNQPAVPEQPVETTGWSFNFQQAFGEKLVLFARLNGANKSVETIKQSYVLGAIYNNPFNRNELDEAGFSVGVNRLNQSVNGAGTRKIENVAELYYSFAIGSLLTITPDVQVYINPALKPDNNMAFVTSLRATVQF